jgi:Brp/Blh family beta-carotene 15,15'-monooxygenase
MSLTVVRPVPDLRPEPAGTGSTTGVRGRPFGPDLGPVMLLAVTAAAALLIPSTLARHATAIAAVGILAGVPHGAVDHLIPWWTTARPTSRRHPGRAAAMAAFLVLYAATAATVLAVLLLAPAPALTVLLLLAASHFGRGEVVAWAARAGRPVPTFSGDLLSAAAHGGVVVGTLLWAHPSATGPVLRELSPQLAAWALRSRTPGLLIVAGLVLFALVNLSLHARMRDAVDLVVLGAAFVCAPPLVAFGCYFGGWHAIRHADRLLDLARGRGTRRAAYRRLGAAAILPTGVALLTAAALWWERSTIGLGAVIAVLLALTVPHTGVIAALDRYERSRGIRQERETTPSN